MKRIYYIFFLATLLISCEKPISEFQSENFIKYFGSGYESKGNDVIELSEGGYVITGYDKLNTSDIQIFAAKIDMNGNLIWSNTYGKNGFNEEGIIAKEVTDGFLITGTSSPGSSGTIRSFIMKTNVYGDSLWYKEFGDTTYNIVVNDILISSNSIYVAGHSTKSDIARTDYYSAKLSLSGELYWERKINFEASNSTFKKVFLQGDNLLLIGTDGIENRISIVTSLQNNGIPIDFKNTETVNESAADASLFEDKLYILANNAQSSTKLSKLNSSNDEEWHTELISSIAGKSIAYHDDGTLMVCGESVEEGNPAISFIKVDSNGNTDYGPQSFRTFQGTIGRVIQTKDKGLIIVGTTNATFGANIQLIKTDKDLFLLKP